MASVSVVERAPHGLDSEPQILLLKLHSSKKRVPPCWETGMLARSEPRAAGAETPPGPRGPGPAGRGACPPGRAPGPGEGCRVDPPRSPEEGGRGVTGGTPGAQTGRTPGSFQRTAHRHRDGRRSCCRSGDAGHTGVLLERLTQGRTGVVRLARSEPPRREAWAIFSPEMDPRVRAESGEGHRFQDKPVKQDWCDACSRLITAQALKCQNCSYTCHLACESRVQLDCNQRDKEPEETPSARSVSSPAAPLHKQSETKQEEEGGTKELSEEEVRTRIEEYNAQVSKNGMKLATDGSYTGFIKVHLRLNRPVTVPALETAGSEGASKLASSHGRSPSEKQDQPDCGHVDKRTSFYLPCDCVKRIHIGSMTTTKEVIQGLLKKFMVLDNPRKFALYKQTHRDGQDLFQKLPLPERPLVLRLVAGPDTEQLTFVLKENETEEVEWHAFSLPELQNFLVILQKEEAERIRAVEQKYTIYRQKLQHALQQHDSEP